MKYVVNEESLNMVANEIRTKSGHTASLRFPDEFASEIRGLTGGTVTPKDVNFFDWDGTLLHSYTAAEFASAAYLPANPSHTGWTSHGWNWSLADAKAYAAAHGKLNIGQQYTIDDGKTSIYITLQEGRTSPYLGLAINGTVHVDWGDGSTSEMTGDSLQVNVYQQHEYAAPGDYVIRFWLDSDMQAATIQRDPDNYFYLNALLTGRVQKDAHENWDQNFPYRNAVRRVDVGANVRIGVLAFEGCYSMKNIMIPYGTDVLPGGCIGHCSVSCVVIPDGITEIDGAFIDDACLDTVSLPNSVTVIGDSAFGDCTALQEIMVPDSVQTIEFEAFGGCERLRAVSLPRNIGETCDIAEGTYINCYSLAEIVIPAGTASIDAEAFRSCVSLSRVVIPASVEYIGANAFRECLGLAYVRFESSTPPELENVSAFEGPLRDYVIYVPAGSISAYTSAGYSNIPNATLEEY